MGVEGEIDVWSDWEDMMGAEQEGSERIQESFSRVWDFHTTKFINKNEGAEEETKHETKKTQNKQKDRNLIS